MQPLSLQGLIDFTKKKSETDTTYDFMDNRNCAMAQYLRSLGYKNVNVGGDNAIYSIVMPEKWYHVLFIRRPSLQRNRLYFTEMFPEISGSRNMFYNALQDRTWAGLYQKLLDIQEGRGWTDI